MIYFLRRENGDIKIGITGGILDGRKSNLEQRYGALETLGVMDGGRSEETVLHAKFWRFRQDGEFFTSAPELLEYIQQNAHERVKQKLAPVHLPPVPRPDTTKRTKIVNRLQELMSVAGVTLDDVAVGTDIPHNMLSRWNKNYVDRFDTAIMDKLIDYFSCGVDDLLARVQD